MTEIQGWIDEVEDGHIWGRLVADGDELGFDMALADVLECQRAYIQPGAYVTFPNGFLLVHKSIFTTHEMETANAEAKKRWKALGWDNPLPWQSP